MKFGKRLASQIEETLPEWRDKFLSYKQLKKRLKVMSAPDCFTEAALESSGSPAREATSVVDVAVNELRGDSLGVAAAAAELAQSSRSDDDDENSNEVKSSSVRVPEEEPEFARLLDVELDKFNNFFVEKEEEYVIRLQELKERIERTKDKPREDPELQQQLVEIRRDIVTFHGEMVLLLNYSSLNYTGLVKILKKHDKLTGTSLRLPFIQGVLKQPFFTTELLSKLVRECENNLQSTFPSDEPASATTDADDGDADGTEQCETLESIYRGTVAALQTIRELRKGSSTYSPLSLPPLA